MRRIAGLLVAGLLATTGVSVVRATAVFDNDPREIGIDRSADVQFVSNGVASLHVHSVIEWDDNVVPIHFSEGFQTPEKPRFLKNVLDFKLKQQSDEIEDSLKTVYDQAKAEIRAQLKAASIGKGAQIVGMVQDDSIYFVEMTYLPHWNNFRSGLANKALLSYKITARNFRGGDFYKLSVAFANAMSEKKPAGAKWKFLKYGTTTSKMIADPCLSVFEIDCDARAICTGTLRNKWRILPTDQTFRSSESFYGCICSNLLESSLSLVEHRYRVVEHGFTSHETKGMLCIPNEYALGRLGYKISDNIVWGGIWAIVVTSLVMFSLIIICIITWNQRETYNRKLD